MKHGLSLRADAPAGQKGRQLASLGSSGKAGSADTASAKQAQPAADADAAAAVFSSSVPWEWARWGLHPEGEGFGTGVIVAVDDLITVYWILNLIAENEGAARIPNGQFPRYPTDAGGNRIGTPSLPRLEKLGLIEREDGPGYITVTLGYRASEATATIPSGLVYRRERVKGAGSEVSAVPRLGLMATDFLHLS